MFEKFLLALCLLQFPFLFKAVQFIVHIAFILMMSHFPYLGEKKKKPLDCPVVEFEVCCTVVSY